MGEKIKITAGITALVLLYGLVGNMDYVDALERENMRLKAASCGSADYVAWRREMLAATEDAK